MPAIALVFALQSSAPLADQFAAIAKNAQAQAGQYSDVTFEAVNPTNDITQQIGAVETLINKKVDALVILPNDGSQLTSLGRRAMAAGIPVINLDRIFDSAQSYRTWIGGDNYRMGLNAGNYIAQKLNSKGTVVEPEFLPAKPVKPLSAAYPPQALQSGKAGYVVVEFLLDSKGRANKAKVVESSPPGIFDGAALAAVSGGRYDISALGDDKTKRSRIRISFKP